ncbi:hypothetical protein Hanom_Chr09g00797751 [Helianthus anomalus]
MKSRTKIQMRTHSGLKRLPKTGSKTTITIRDYVEGYAMATYDLISIDLCKFLHFEIFTNRKKVADLVKRSMITQILL